MKWILLKINNEVDINLLHIKCLMIKNNVQYFQIMVKLGEEEKLSKGNLPLRSQVFAHYLYLRRQKVESGEWNGKAMSRSMMQQEQ